MPVSTVPPDPTFNELLVANDVTATWVARAAGINASVTLALRAADKGHRISMSFRPESAEAIANVFGLAPDDIVWSLPIAEVGKPSGQPDRSHAAPQLQRWGADCQSCFMPMPLTGVCDNCD